MKTINDSYTTRERKVIATELREIREPLFLAGEFNRMASAYVLRVLHPHQTFNEWLLARRFAGITEFYIREALNRLADDLDPPDEKNERERKLECLVTKTIQK